MSRLGILSRRKMARGTLTAALAAVSAYMCAGGLAFAEEGGVKIGYAQNTLGEQFQATESRLFIEQAEKLGLQVMAINPNQKSDAQHNAVMQMVNAGVKGIVINPVDAKAVIPAIKYATSRNIPVVTIDTRAGGGEVYMAVGANNRDMAAQACDAVGKQLGGTGEVLMLSLDLKNSVGLDRAKGFQDCMKEKYPSVTIYEHVADADPAKAGAGAQAVLTAHSDVKAIYMATDTLYLTPTWSALQRLNKAHVAGEAGHIYMVSIDGSPTGLAGIREGRMDLVISQPLNRYGEFAAKYIQAAINGEKQSVGTGISGPITDVDGHLTAYISADLVTKENVDDPALWGNSK